jgi:predicted TIM-barrel fold metal-dependent hydrolase
MNPLKIVGLEEHFVTPGLLDAWMELPPDRRDLAFGPATEGDTGRRLLELGPARIAAMDATGLSVQVLSLTTPGVQNVPVRQAVALAQEANDLLAATIRARPDRFQGLAALPTSVPGAAAEEFERALSGLGLEGAMLNGRTGHQHLDHVDLWPVYEVAERWGAPLHLHPQSPEPSVRNAYYAGFEPAVGAAFATFGVGWHYDTGVEFLRMVIAGVFERFPELQVVVGHWGELVLFFLERIQHLANVAGLPRNLHEYARNNLMVAPSGILSPRYLRWAVEVVGVDRIVFSTDYPFEAASLGGAQDFLAAAELSEHERSLVASGNWDRLRAGPVRDWGTKRRTLT